LGLKKIKKHLQNKELRPFTAIKTRGPLVVSTHLKNISQFGSFPQVGVKIKDI